jgi:hypothetical protein
LILYSLTSSTAGGSKAKGFVDLEELDNSYEDEEEGEAEV